MVKYPTFSKLVENHLQRKEVKVADIHRYITEKCKIPMDYDTIRRYIRGERRPDPAFVILLKPCLELTTEEHEKLQMAVLIEHISNASKEYNNAFQMLSQMTPCLVDFTNN